MAKHPKWKIRWWAKSVYNWVKKWVIKAQDANLPEEEQRIPCIFNFKTNTYEYHRRDMKDY